MTWTRALAGARDTYPIDSRVATAMCIRFRRPGDPGPARQSPMSITQQPGDRLQERSTAHQHAGDQVPYSIPTGPYDALTNAFRVRPARDRDVYLLRDVGGHPVTFRAQA